ncbi:MAG: hypothetical protein DMF72_00925 [Acidobacteria bacterium]|nr:MAG: hypothetical protein DMF72_00925 [Acidobacteriota bacterium]
MKRFLALVSFLVLAAACTNQPMDNKNMTSNANSGDKMKAAGPSEADIIAKEKASWDAFRKKDADAFKKLLTPEYFGVNNSGVEDTATSIAAMKDTEISDVTFADWKMTTIDKDAVLLTYTATVKATYKGKSLPPGPYYEASAYVSRNGEWLDIYYQETLQQKMPMSAATPAPAKSPSSPMAKAADTTDDPVANEKLVWDAIKSKNYDAFGSYLASDSIEIEPEGLFDKAGSVQGVQGFDASKAEASDWKTVKFDDDASVVTYKVKVPGMKPNTAYHSTIWVKRDGKWRAFFHMGTPAQDLTAMPAPEKSASPESKMSPEKKMSPTKKPSP